MGCCACVADRVRIGCVNGAPMLRVCCEPPADLERSSEGLKVEHCGVCILIASLSLFYCLVSAARLPSYCNLADPERVHAVDARGGLREASGRLCPC